jgi:hypothetical protein
MKNRFTDNNTPVTDVVIVSTRKFGEKFERLADTLRAEGLTVHTPLSPIQIEAPSRTEANKIAMGAIGATKALLVCNYDSEDFGLNGVSYNVAMEMAAAFLCDIPIFLLNGIPTGKQDVVMFTNPTVLNGYISKLVKFVKGDE